MALGYDARPMGEGRGESLWVVLPVFDEEAAIERVFEEWLPVLRATGADLRVLAIDDGSRDRSLERLRAIERDQPEVAVLSQANRGHGESCLGGYRAALAAGADWVFQIDSDGQCDPRFFPEVWAVRREHPVVFGYRRRRDDGWARWAISRLVSVVGWLATGTWVADANVPYRLMRADRLARALDSFPERFGLANVLLAHRLTRLAGIRWVPIRFRARQGGQTSLDAASFARQGWRLLRQLRDERRRSST